MNIDYIGSIVISISNVLATMASINASRGKSSVKNDAISKGDVTGIIGMTSAQVKGSFALSFSKASILEIISKMLGEEFTEINEDVTDCVGELTNMVAGGAKKIMMEKGVDFEMATPVVIQGDNHQVVHQFKGTVITIPFETEHGVFFSEICLEDNKQDESPHKKNLEKTSRNAINKHVLIGDNDFSSLHILRQSLEKKGYKISLANDFDSFHEKIRKIQDFQLIITEPLLRGNKATRIYNLIKDNDYLNETPVIYISTLLETEFIKLFGDPQVACFFEKPISIASLLNKVDTMIR